MGVSLFAEGADVKSSPSLEAVRAMMKDSTTCSGGVMADMRASLARFFGSITAVPFTSQHDCNMRH